MSEAQEAQVEAPVVETPEAEPVTRAQCTFERFVEVAIAGRDEFPTVALASEATGLTPASFRQRLKTETERYPELFKGLKEYERTAGRKVATPSEAAEILARVMAAKAKAEGADEAEDTNEPAA